MKNILILGGTGQLGKKLIPFCLERNYFVTALVRNPKKITLIHQNLKILQGSVTHTEDLSKALAGIDVVVSVLGHGLRTSYPIQEKTMLALIPIMEKKKIARILSVTGAGLKIEGDPRSFLADITEKLFTLIDPYRMKDAKNQQLLLEHSNLDWTVVRTPIHRNEDVVNVVHVGFTQPMPWQAISRKTICDFVIQCIESSTFIKKAPIVFSIGAENST